MKFLWFIALVCYPLAAQPNAGSYIVDFGGDVVNNQYAHGLLDDLVSGSYLLSNIKYSWQITSDGYTKSFTFSAWNCVYATVAFSIGKNSNGVNGYLSVTPLATPVCTKLTQSPPEIKGPTDAALTEYYSVAPEVYHHPPEFLPYGAGHQLAALVPAAPVDPQMIFLDGLSYNIVEFDLTTFAMTSSVTLPPQAIVFGIRPSATGPENEVWTAHAGTINQISISDLGAQSVLANIPTPSLDPNESKPVGIVFTNSGLTALYAVGYYTPDSAGNNGVLLVFDVVSRKLRSTLPLKYRPTALLMAPDGLTAYLLSDTGMITYYDVLSTTDDLSVSTFTPGMGGGYNPPDQVFVHPDGTRLFWNYGFNMMVFDLTTHKITNQFSSGLSGGALASMQMSQDGSTMWFADTLGNVVILDTRYGGILAAYQGLPFSAVYPGPAY